MPLGPLAAHMDTVPSTSLAPAPSTRPLGVTILGILAAIACVIGIPAAFALMALSTFLVALGGIWAVLGAAAGFALLAYAVVCGIAAFGLLKRRTFGWYLGIGLLAFGLLSALVSLVTGDFFSGLFGAAINAAGIWYLTTPPVQAWFGTKVAVPWAKTVKA